VADLREREQAEQNETGSSQKLWTVTEEVFNKHINKR
jgi:hypothetical protein